jgi:hypothetical protein
VTVLSAGDITGQSLSGLIGAVVGAVITVTIVFLTPLAQRRYRYDATILARRMIAYEELLKLLKPTSHYMLEQGHTIDQEALAASLTSWYYEGHGLYPTIAVRDGFFDLRNNAATYDPETILARASALRSQMTADIGSRRPALLESELKKRT